MNDHTTERAQDIRSRYLAVDTANAADVLDALGLTDQALHELRAVSSDHGPAGRLGPSDLRQDGAIRARRRRPGEDARLRRARSRVGLGLERER